MRLDDLSALCIIHADNRAFLHLIMREQRGFHFWSGDVVTSRYNHVIRARHESEAPVLMHERVAGDVPAALHVTTLARIVQVTASGGAAHSKAADRATRDLLHC